MKFVFRPSKNIDLDDDLKNHIKKTLNTLQKYKQVQEDDTAQISLKYFKSNTAEMSVFIDIIKKEYDLKASVHAENFYKAIDEIRHELEKQIKKIKQKSNQSNTKHRVKLAKIIVDQKIKESEDIIAEDEMKKLIKTEND